MKTEEDEIEKEHINFIKSILESNTTSKIVYFTTNAAQLTEIVIHERGYPFWIPRQWFFFYIKFLNKQFYSFID